MAFTAISLYTGAGGMDVGFRKAGFNILWANDIFEDACKTYELNHEGVIRCGDIDQHFWELNNYRETDLVFGGPPCQGFSVAGKMDPSDIRSQQVFRFMDVVETIRPKAFVMENVRALGELDKWEDVRQALFSRAKQLDFEFIQLVILNATEFGVPQKRERMFLVGIRNSIEGLDINNYINKYQEKASKVGEIIRKLGKAGSVTNPRICKARITLATNPVMRKSPYAGMLFNGAGRPINPDDYANTLPASMGGNKTPIVDEDQIFHDKKSWVEEYHQKLLDGYQPVFEEAPKRLRRLTIDEALQIQTFPDNYNFFGRANSIYTQIGNAVPCKLAFAVGSATIDMLNDCYPSTDIKLPTGATRQLSGLLASV